MADDVYRQLAASIRLGHSERIAKLWAMMADKSEAEMLLAMPGTAAELSEKTGRSAGETEAMLGTMFQKGVTYVERTDAGDIWARPRGMIHFHDMSVLWSGIPDGYIELWKEFREEEYPGLVDAMKAMGVGSLARVVPVNKAIESGTEVMPYEDVARMIEGARALAVTPCRCRLTFNKCDNPRDTCIQINEFADYALKRGVGRAISKEEAMAILDSAEEAGLIHVSENRAGGNKVICNCCPCCCMLLGMMLKAGAFAGPSRYTAAVGDDACSGCGLCEERCHAKAISLDSGAAAVDPARCIGCGLCASACPDAAIHLKESRPLQFIP